MPTIQQGFARILQYGNSKHKAIIRGIQGSIIYMPLENLGMASGDCAVLSQESTQRAIYNGQMSIARAYSELRLRVHFKTAQTYAGLEGTLVHETRHAYHMARAISEMSYGKRDFSNPTGFEIEYAANVAYVEYVQQAIRLNHPDKQIFINEAVNSLGIARQVGNTIEVNISGIRNRLWTQYGTNDTTHKGKTFSDNWKLYPNIQGKHPRPIFR